METFPVFSDGAVMSLSPAEIERELSSMWKPINENENASVSRVVLGNVLWLGCSSRFEYAKKILQKVMTKFPARLFLCDYDENNTDENITAMVNAQCFLPPSGTVPVCCEFIHLKFGPKSARHLRGSVAPLLLPDLQTMLWTTLGSVEFPHLRDLQQHVDRTIRMSSLSEHPAAIISSIIESSHPTFDLSWFRMTPIREQVINFFDDPENHFNLRKIAKVRITLGRKRTNVAKSLPEVMAAMLTGWIGSRLQWKYKRHDANGVHFLDSVGNPVTVEESTGKGNDGRCDLYNYIELEEENGVTLRIAIDKEHLDLICDEEQALSTERHLHLGELEEPDALGTALNYPATARRFRDAATLALPILKYIQERKDR